MCEISNNQVQKFQSSYFPDKSPVKVVLKSCRLFEAVHEL